MEFVQQQISECTSWLHCLKLNSLATKCISSCYNLLTYNHFKYTVFCLLLATLTQEICVTLMDPGLLQESILSFQLLILKFPKYSFPDFWPFSVSLFCFFHSFHILSLSILMNFTLSELHGDDRNLHYAEDGTLIHPL